MVEDDAFSHKIDYDTIFKEILNSERHPNYMTGNFGWILPNSRASAVKGLRLQPGQQACFLTERKTNMLEKSFTQDGFIKLVQF